MLRRIHLHGPYAAFHNGPIEIVADTIWEAVEAVVSQIKGFQPDAILGRKKIQVLGFPTIESLKQKSDVQDIHLCPPMGFGKNSGIIQTIVGVALIVAAVAFLPVTSVWFAIVASAGVSMIVGGVMQMLSPQPQLNVDNETQERSKYLGGTANTVRIGTPIPILYGKYRAGGQILSFNIDSKDSGL